MSILIAGPVRSNVKHIRPEATLNACDVASSALAGTLVVVRMTSPYSIQAIPINTEV